MKTQNKLLPYLLSGCALFTFSCAVDSQEDVARESLEGMEDFRPSKIIDREAFQQVETATASDLTTKDNGDGTWSYVLPDDFDINTAVAGRLVTWRYAGQARYSNESVTTEDMRSHVVREDEILTPKQRLKRLTRIDALGRIWRVAKVDVEAWERASAPDPIELEEVALIERAHEPELPIGTVVPWQPLSWNHDNCVGGIFSAKEGHRWNGESRVAKTGSLTDRQETAVKVFANGTQCSGVIIRQDEILTAAHCVSDNSNNPIPNSSVTVCRFDGECRGAADIDFSGSYGGGSGSGGGTDFADDWAIVELSGSWTTTSEDMDLSSASDTTISNLSNLKNLGFPGFAPICANANGNTLFFNKENEPVASVANKKLNMKIDGGGGHSGGPIYYCPNGDNNLCGPGDTGFVIGVFAGWNSVSNRHVGPKVPFFKATATVFLDD